ncbi:MAG: DnaT-like ssDNA-binding protein [bacterium]
MITTIIINGISYISYASLDEANARLAVDPTRGPSWSALSDDEKGMFLISSTNRLDLLRWNGKKRDGSSQLNKWPRTGVFYCDGSSVSSNDVPNEVENSTILLAGAIVLNPKISDLGSSGSNIKKAKADTVDVTFFTPKKGVAMQDETAYKLISCFLVGKSNVLTAYVSGENDKSYFSNIKQFDKDKGFL